MELEYITEEEAPWRPDLCRVWEQSVDLATQPDPFCCAPIWQLSAHKAFAPGRRVLAQSTEDSALVLAEAFLSSGQPLLTSLEAHWLFGCPLQGPDAIGLLAEALAVMSHSYGHLPALLLGGIVPGSRRARELYACGMLGPCYRGQQFSYDAAWKDLSIGNLLQVEQIRWLCEEGAVRYDMGTASGEPMAYKMHWTEAHPTSQTWFLQPR